MASYHDALVEKLSSMSTLSQFYLCSAVCDVLFKTFDEPYGTGSSEPSMTQRFLSFRAAQDAWLSPLANPAPSADTKSLHLLWTKAHEVINAILESSELGKEPFGWGVYAMSVGYIDVSHSSPILYPILLFIKTHTD